MKKGSAMGLSLLVSSVFFLSLSLVSSASPADAFAPIGDMIVGIVNELAKIFDSIFGILLGYSNGEMDNIAARIAIFLVVYVIVHWVVGKMGPFEERTWTKVIIAAAVGVLGVRFLSAEFIDTVILSNQAFAIAVTAGLPFVALFFITKDWDSQTARRVAWVFLLVTLFAVWMYRSESGISSVGDTIYPLVALAIIVMIALDGTWHRVMAKMKVEKAKAGASDQMVLVYQEQMAKIQAAYSRNLSGYIGVLQGGGKGKKNGTAAYVGDMEELRRRIAAIS